jgi:hypothetical protein
LTHLIALVMMRLDGLVTIVIKAESSRWLERWQAHRARTAE